MEELMLHMDYTMDIEYGRWIILDEELTLERLRFKEGDLLEVSETKTGCVMLRKVDPVTRFTLGYPKVDSTQG
jgi:hypothetical protein